MFLVTNENMGLCLFILKDTSYTKHQYSILYIKIKLWLQLLLHSTFASKWAEEENNFFIASQKVIDFSFESSHSKKSFKKVKSLIFFCSAVTQIGGCKNNPLLNPRACISRPYKIGLIEGHLKCTKIWLKNIYMLVTVGLF